MDYGEQYLTYKEYVKMGGTIEQTPFNLLEFEARRKIDERTLNRLVGNDDVPDEVRICMFKLIGLMSTYDDTLEKAISGNIASENIDGYSVSYLKGNQITETIKAKENQINDIITTYLNGVVVDGVNILYLGVC